MKIDDVKQVKVTIGAPTGEDGKPLPWSGFPLVLDAAVTSHADLVTDRKVSFTLKLGKR